MEIWHEILFRGEVEGIQDYPSAFFLMTCLQKRWGSNGRQAAQQIEVRKHQRLVEAAKQEGGAGAQLLLFPWGFCRKKNRGLGDFDEIELKEKNLMSLVVEILVVQERVELKSSQS